jgi:FixJ family two-component response regulator
MGTPSRCGRRSKYTNKEETQLVSANFACPRLSIAEQRVEAPIVFVVDGDPRVCESLASLISSAGWRPQTANSAEEFLTLPRSLVPNCLVTEVQLPGASGLELQRLVQCAETPVIFLSSRQTDVQSGVLAMKAGAFEYMLKPYVGDVLLHSLREAIERSRIALCIDSEMRVLRNSYDALTPREREVMQLVVHGLLNKQVASELGIAEYTVKLHRGRVMRKMHAVSLANLVTMADRLGLREHPSYSFRLGTSSGPTVRQAHVSNARNQ